MLLLTGNNARQPFQFSNGLQCKIVGVSAHCLIRFEFMTNPWSGWLAEYPAEVIVVQLNTANTGWLAVWHTRDG